MLLGSRGKLMGIPSSVDWWFVRENLHPGTARKPWFFPWNVGCFPVIFPINPSNDIKNARKSHEQNHRWDTFSPNEEPHFSKFDFFCRQSPGGAMFIHFWTGPGTIWISRSEPVKLGRSIWNDDHTDWYVMMVYQGILKKSTTKKRILFIVLRSPHCSDLGSIRINHHLIIM